MPYLKYLIWPCLVFLYYPVFRDLYTKAWEVRDYTHAYFILPISLWLVWRKRDKISELIKKSGPNSLGLFGLLLFICGALIFIFGWRLGYLMLTTISLIPVLFGLTWYLYGPAVVRAVSFPLLYLLLLVPPPLGILDNLTIPMRYGISITTEHILRAFGYPIVRDGLILSLGGHEIFMGAPCSGFRSLITLFSLGIVYVYISKGSLIKKSIMVGAIVPLALLGNLIRVIATCLASYHFGEAMGQKVHDFGGFAIFIVIILGLVGIENLLDKKDARQ